MEDGYGALTVKNGKRETETTSEGLNLLRELDPKL
jgi:hypothetical protein